MLTVSCPSCGAPCAFRSHASVMAVCEYCRTTVLKDLGAVDQLGKLSEVLEDYSPIQIGTSGVAGGRPFTVIGRIQLRYPDGVWNEWYLMFDDGGNGWLGDASGQYMLTTPRDAAGPISAFDKLKPGNLAVIGGERFVVADRRVARCIGGQGELPFRVDDGWEARVVDLRSGKRFVTIDYSDGQGDGARLFSGVSVTLAELKCQLLRDEEQIKTTAGRYRGKLGALDCPSCGSGIKYVPGVTANLVCPSCAAQLDAAGPQAQVIAAGQRVERAGLSLTLGSQANVHGSAHTVIGAMIRSDDEGSRWTEYLLYGVRAGFVWLIESEEGWYRSTVLDDWPEWHRSGGSKIRFEGATFDKSTEYPARVEFVAGAFNWKVAVGDTVRVIEFDAAEFGRPSLAAELNAHEMTWSRSHRVPDDQLKAWFGRLQPTQHKTAPKPKPGAVTTPATPASLPVKFMWWIVALNFIPLLFNFFTTAIVVIAALIAIFYPPAIFKPDDSERK